MNHPHREHRQRLHGMLTDAEQRDLDLIVGNARSMGWLTCRGTLTATKDSQGVLVRVVDAGSRQERRYEDGTRWLYQLLHELAQGTWKVTAITTD